METNAKTGRRVNVITKYEPTVMERQEILKATSDSAFLLFQYYLRITTMPDPIMEDDNAAKYFNWSISKVSRLRRDLEKAFYFKKIIYTSSTGKKSTTYYVGKDVVEAL